MIDANQQDLEKKVTALYEEGEWTQAIELVNPDAAVSDGVLDCTVWCHHQLKEMMSQHELPVQ